MSKTNSKTCFYCKKAGHNISTCVSARKQGILLENHIQAMIDICGCDKPKKRVKISQYLRNLSIVQQKLLCIRIGNSLENHLSSSIVLKYFMDKQKSKRVMMKIYGNTNNNNNTISSCSVSITITTNPAEPITCPSPSISNKSERKQIV
jgi:hypothetical protein